jgi:streptomycin 6-kinase
VISVLEPVRRSVESQGPVGRSWLAALPDLVDELCRDWPLTVGDALDGGKWAYVARVRTDHGTDAVLKVALPTLQFDRQLGTITAAAGRGYVHLYDADSARCALLMEPLGPMLSAAGWPVEHVLDVLAATLREAWQVPRPAEATVPLGTDKASGLIEILNEWSTLGRPCTPRPIALTHDWSTRLADATGLNEQTVWEWALIERVTSGLYLMLHGHQAEGRAFLASAERLTPST